MCWVLLCINVSTRNWFLDDQNIFAPKKQINKPKIEARESTDHNLGINEG